MVFTISFSQRSKVHVVELFGNLAQLHSRPSKFYAMVMMILEERYCQECDELRNSRALSLNLGCSEKDQAVAKTVQEHLETMQNVGADVDNDGVDRERKKVREKVQRRG